MTAAQGPVLATASTLIDGLRQGAGDNWIGFCPIHGEERGRSTPSFSFNAATGQWHCFAGCGAGGLPQLLKKLRRSEQYIERTMERLRPHLALTRKKSPASVLAAAAGAFMTDYPLPEKLLGLYAYVPQELLRAGFDEQVLLDNDVGVDTKLDRTTYAIRDLHGMLAGIVGKPNGGGSGGKYMVYERELVDLGFRGYHFNNRQFCWRWERVYAALYHRRDAGPVYVTEGYKAALWLVQHGYYNTVALMGTGISDVQQMFLERLGVRIVLCGDNDHWGRVGTAKIGYKLRGQDVAVMRYPLPEVDLQPDDLTADELTEALERPLSLRRWKQRHEHCS
jgi:hypothetical protein